MAQPLQVPPPGFDDLSADEQIDYVQTLWDRIASSETKLPIPDWHREVLGERLADLDANPNAGRPWDEVEADLIESPFKR